MSYEQLDARLSAFAAHGAQLPELAAFVRDVGPSAFLAWAREHRRWTFVVAEVASEVCAKPPEAALEIARRIVEELQEDGA